MLKILFFFSIAILSILFSAKNVYAIEDPVSIPNNKFGVHILFPSELEKARDLVNSNGGDWGHVTIPIQAGDKDIEKWQAFMDLAGENHLIPIIRIATENYYFETRVWRKPSYDDIVDFANFLNTLNWPVKNRYVIIFNEVNRGDEWEGFPNPGEYADILNFAVDIFKSRSEDFFVISAGLDNAAANIPGSSVNQYDFMLEMNKEIPGIFGKIDGLGSHSYPNPAFAQPPSISTRMSAASFRFEKDLAENLSGKSLPIFITETGWSKKALSENTIAEYFSHAFESVWSDPNIAAVTPFLLQAGGEPFSQFSLLNEHGGYSDISTALKEIPKIKGNPTINYKTILSPNLQDSKNNVPIKTFSQKTQYENLTPEKVENIKALTAFFRWLLKLPI